MILSDTDIVSDLLKRIFAVISNNPSLEEKVKFELESLLQKLEDSVFDYGIPKQSYEVDTVDDSSNQNKEEMKDNELTEETNSFSSFLYNHFGRCLYQKELIDLANELGPSHGLFLTREDKRKKENIISWFQKYYDVLEKEIIEKAKVFKNDKMKQTDHFEPL